jgi:hypothetical protein
VIIHRVLCENPIRGVLHYFLAIYMKKYLKAKRRIMDTPIFHHGKIEFSKKSSERNQNPSRYYISVTISTQAKISSFKNPSYKN